MLDGLVMGRNRARSDDRGLGAAPAGREARDAQEGQQARHEAGEELRHAAAPDGSRKVTLSEPSPTTDSHAA